MNEETLKDTLCKMNNAMRPYLRFVDIKDLPKEIEMEETIDVNEEFKKRGNKLDGSVLPQFSAHQIINSNDNFEAFFYIDGLKANAISNCGLDNTVYFLMLKYNTKEIEIKKRSERFYNKNSYGVEVTTNIHQPKNKKIYYLPKLNNSYLYTWKNILFNYFKKRICIVSLLPLPKYIPNKVKITIPKLSSLERLKIIKDKIFSTPNIEIDIEVISPIFSAIRSSIRNWRPPKENKPFDGIGLDNSFDEIVN